MKRIAILFALTASVCSGQSPSGLLAPNRYIDWSQAGAGTIPARTTVCASLTSSATPSAVASALASCPAGQTVYLAAGTYNWSSSLVTTASNVTLRGAGPTQTILQFTNTSTNCNGIGAVGICIENPDGSAIEQYAPNTLNWTAGYSQGATTLTAGSAVSGSLSNLHVGSLLSLTQTDQSSDNGNWWSCGSTGSTGTCSQQGADNTWPGRSESQIVTVTGISGSTITVSPGLYAPDWSSGRTPYMTFSSSLPISGFGLENLTVDTQSITGSGLAAMVEFSWASNSWIKNVSLINNTAAGGAFHKHVFIGNSQHITVRDSYMYGSSPTLEGYGTDLTIGTSDSLIENNIAHHMATAFMFENGVGNVIGYNFDADNFYVGVGGTAPNWQGSDVSFHDAGNYYNLIEGYEGIQFSGDTIHGTSFANTMFRSYFSGRDPANTCPPSTPSCGTATKTQDTQAVQLNAFARYYNIVANVLGTSTYFNTYQQQGASGSPSSCPAYNWTSVYNLNFGSNLSPFSPACTGSSFTIDNDPLVSSTLMRWGNYDGVTGTVRTNSGETAAPASTYPGLSTPSTSWASFPSFYLLARPSWWVFPSGNSSTPWPGIGPEVTGGNIASTIGHAYLNPAANCYLNVLGGLTNGSSGSFASTYDASACYPAVTPSWTITTATAGTGAGTISGCAGSHVAGSTFTCTVLPAAGSNITSVTGCGGSGTTNFTGTMPNNDCTVTATFNNTLSTPTFTPSAGSYLGTQTVSISIPSGTLALINAMQETSNANDLIGSAPHGNTYTNCIATCASGSPAPSPFGTLWCTAAIKSDPLIGSAKCPSFASNGVVSSNISGTGMAALDNGNGAGGSDSAASVTATYGGVTGTACGVHGAAASAYVPGLTFPDPGPNAQMVYGITTGSPGNSSILTVRKYNSSGDAGNYVAQRDCFTPNSVSVLGAHYESDYNYTTTGGTYMGFGKDYDIPNKHWRAAPQGQPWVVEELCPVAGGACSSTYNLPAGDSVLVESYEHWDAGCSYSSSTACAHYDALCLQLWNAGSPVNSMTCYNVRNASTHGTIDFIPINKTSWTHPQYAIQHQWDIDASSATLTATVPFSTAVAYNTTPTICYTTDGSTPTATTPGSCSHGSVYTGPLTISASQTIKAIATQPGFTNSAVGSAAYTITPASSLTAVASNGAISGTNCSSGTYATGTSIGACTFTPSAGYSFTGWSGTGACSGVSGTGTASCTLSSDSTLTASTAPIVTCGDPSQLSPNFSGTYVVPPTVLPFTVGFTSPTAGCTMHYTSDGSAPTCSSTAYPGGDFTISSVGAYTYRVIACQTGYVSSNVVGGTWTVLSSSSVRVTLTGTQTITGQGTLQ